MTKILPTVFLHIGHGKTGTSATQNLFTLNRDVLRDMGICYPDHRDVRDAQQGKISSGNILWRTGDVALLADEIRGNVEANPGFAKYVFSSEYMYLPFLDLLPLLLGSREKYQFSVVISVREPLEMIASYYSQMVKRHGFFGKIDEIVDHQTFLPHAANSVQACKLSKVDVHVLNYSTLRKKISETIFEVVGVDTSDLPVTDVYKDRIVNRSLTHEETKLIKSLNKVLGGHVGSLCSDALVQHHPDIHSEALPVPTAVARKLAAHNEEAANLLNEFLPAEHKILLSVDDARASARPAEVTPDQLDTVFGALRHILTNDDLLLKENHRLQRDLHHARTYPWKYVWEAAAMRLRGPKSPP